MINRNNLNLNMPHSRIAYSVATKRSEMRAVYLLAVLLGGSIGVIALKMHRSSKTVTALEIEAPSHSSGKETVAPITSSSTGTLIAAAADEEKQVQTETTESNSFSSKATIPAGETSLKICYDQLSPASQIYLTETQRTQNKTQKTGKKTQKAQGSENVILFVKKKVPFNPETGDCSHLIAALPRPIDHDLEFTWWVIN